MFTPRKFLVTANVLVHFADKDDKAMCNKDMPVGRQIKKSSISQMVMIQMLKNGMQPVQRVLLISFFCKYWVKIYRAREVSSGKEFALKVISVMREKDIMTSLTYLHGGHPYFVSLYCTFQDATRLYFAMTYAKNGDLLTYLHRLGSFDEDVTLFYSAELVCAIDMLHKCGIIHRDLKPENILLGENWHIMLSDFGTAKFINSAEDETDTKSALQEEHHRSRSTFVGTAQYLSPEVLVNGEVGPSCDYWALGAIIFQMVSGLPPFRAINDYHTFQKIQKLDYNFPDGFPDLPKDLVRKFLVRFHTTAQVFDPNKRLGSEETGGIEAIRSHPYFATVDWDNLITKTPPPFKPYLPASCGEPAFHSDYHFPDDIEPGLDDAAITRLLGLSLKDFCSSSQNKANWETEESDSAGLREKKLNIQRKEHKYHRFNFGSERRNEKGLFARRRMFLLTEGPHIFYVDPISMELKGKIPFCQKLRVEAKNFRTFFVHTPSRTYYLFDPERNALEWCKAIEALRERYLNELPEEPDSLDIKNTKRRR
ncbi:hypothetical protein DINM_020601 [Dirofilaria immitis]|nr:hypothetical protein [Dirofilaria immitis]